MAERKIVKTGDPTLRKKSRKVEVFDGRLHKLLDDMAETMRLANGVGLAAVQVGILRRVIVIETEESGLIELINPVITERSEETQTGYEGCLSVPGRWGITTRPMTVKVRAQDRNGKFFELSGSGLLAKAICHETDHLDGIIFTDVADRMLTDEEMRELGREES